MSRIVVLALLLGLPAAAVDRGLLALADPDVNFALGVRIADLATSPLLAPVLEEAIEGNLQASALLGLLGPDFLTRFEEALVLGRVDAGEGELPTDALVLLLGDFSERPWEAMLCASGCSSVSHGGLEIRSSDENEEQPAFVVLSERYAAFGPREKLEAVIDRRGADAAESAGEALEGWVSGLSGAHFWLAAKGPFETPAEAEANPMFSQLAEGLEGFGLGLTIGEDLEIGLEILTDSDEAAQRLYDAAQAMTAMVAMSAASQPEEEAGAAKFLETLKLGRQSRRVTASLRIPGDELLEQVRSQIEQRQAAGEIQVDSGAETSASSTKKAVSPTPAPKRNGGITIHGLEDEPVSVEGRPR